MKSKHALCPLLILSCFSLCLSPFASVREMPRRDDIPPPKSLPQNINAIWADKSPLVLILPTKEKDAKAQEAIHEYARKRSFLQRGEGAEVMPDEEPLKRDLSAKKLIIYGTGEGNLWL
ncbi:MAG: hypothetical protein OEW18_10775, partial [Candidatus Aminicenantes bacterium]|nr:hypothetical protein [Candidatus Aminicenantes bacterium]